MPIHSGETLAAGLLTDYRDAYMTAGRQVPEWLGKVMDLGLTSDKRTETRGYFESAPVMKHRWRGDPINAKGFDSKSFSTTNYNYDLRIEWHRDDREDDQTQSLQEVAMTGGASAATLDYRAFWDLLSGSASLIPVVPNAPDGAAMFSTSTRFGVSGGNTQGSVTWTNAASIRSGIFNGLERFYQMQDTEGQELHGSSVIESEVVCLFSAADTELFMEVFKQETTALGLNTATSNAGVSNSILVSGVNFTPVNAGFRISTGTAYLFLVNARKKAAFVQTRTPVLESTSFSGSAGTGYTHDTAMEYVQWEQRKGYGVGLPYAAVKVTSS